MQSLGIYFKQVTLGWEFEHLESGVDHWLEETEDDSPFTTVTSCHLSRTRDGFFGIRQTRGCVARSLGSPQFFGGSWNRLRLWWNSL